MGPRIPKIPVSVSTAAYFAAAAMLLLLPLPWLMGAALAIVLHEFGHCLCLWLLGCRILRITVKISGIYMEIGGVSPGKELLCALAGPFIGCLWILLGKHFPRTALCAAAYSAFNLLPFYPLDGGRALSCGARVLLPPGAAKIFCTIYQWCTLGLMLAGSLWLCLMQKFGIYPLLFLGILLLKLRK